MGTECSLIGNIVNKWAIVSFVNKKKYPKEKSFLSHNYWIQETWYVFPKIFKGNFVLLHLYSIEYYVKYCDHQPGPWLFEILYLRDEES